MKTKLIALMMAFVPFSNVSIDAAPIPVALQVTAVDPTTNQGEPHRGPVIIPEVGIEDYTLTFSTPCYGYTVELQDEDGYVVYTTIITSDTLVLPSTLEGQYELQIIRDNWCFYGDIEL